jgi:protein arginine kinase activator
MKCDVCEKRNAVAMLTMIANGHSVTRRVCPVCMRKLQRGDAYAAQMAMLGTMEKPKETISCRNCGWTSDKLIRNGHVGCPECYSAFSPLIQPLMEQLNGKFLHEEIQNQTEKPVSEAKTQIDRLREEMFSAVHEENYERAAQLRDAIRALKEEEGTEGE